MAAKTASLRRALAESVTDQPVPGCEYGIAAGLLRPGLEDLPAPRSGEAGSGYEKRAGNSHWLTPRHSASTRGAGGNPHRWLASRIAKVRQMIDGAL